MEFKIDTKHNYTLVCPMTNTINANLTVELMRIYTEIGQSGSQNLIVDLQNCKQITQDAIPALLQMHEDFYANGHSLVFTGLPENLNHGLKNDDNEAIINICPTMAEAIDIINMEILERDLFSEE
jgi:anti-anti-sigma regulatory factor